MALAPGGESDGGSRVYASNHGIAALSIGTVNLGATRPAARTGWREYLEQVSEIAPREGLLGRVGELADMAAFCAGDQPYWWWQAGPWAGKSALMSWFVLHPPAEVLAVSFFITARDASQADSTAFTKTVLGELEELSGGDLPEHAVDAGNARGQLRLLLRATARQCQEQGRRLILVVDGLDEDWGPDAGLPSIASLLPKRCEDGFKVIVAGRPDPQVPADVAADHPLRDPRIVHELGRSDRAAVIRDAAEEELHSLLNGTPLQQDLLGLLIASGGGLALPDLETLTRVAPHHIRQVLRGVTGRTFTARGADGADRVYLMAHETLQAEAVQSLGRWRLSGYRDRLNEWAGTHAAAGWSADTPVYLLSRYFSMLRATGDSDRLIDCATDARRHDRMLSLTGGDTAAQAEISAAQEIILGQPDPDLIAMARLAMHRDDLAAREAAIPTTLPALWVPLGQTDRAEALARSLRDPDSQASALAGVAAALGSVGLLDPAEAVARSIADPRTQASALAKVTAALARAGLGERAEQVAEAAEAAARSVASPGSEVWALIHLAAALASAGLSEKAEGIARSITEPVTQVQALARVAVALAGAGLGEKAVAVASSITDPDRRPSVLTDGAVQSENEWNWLNDEAVALAGAGLAEQAEALARSITDLGAQTRALAEVAAALAGGGLHDLAVQIAEAAEATASLTDPFWRRFVLAGVARALAGAGLHDRAEAVARSITEPDWQALALTDVAKALSVVGLDNRAQMMAEAAEAAVSVS